NFRAQLGYVKRSDVRLIEQEIKYRWKPGHGSIVKFGPSLSTLYNRDHRGRTRDWGVGAEFKVELTGQTELILTRAEAFEDFHELGFRKHSTALEFDSAWLKWLGVSATVSRGTEIDVHPGPGFDAFLADAKQ